MQETLTLLLVNNKGADQPAHPRSLISAIVIRFLKSKVTRSDVSKFYIIFGGLQYDKVSGYAPEIVFFFKGCEYGDMSTECTHGGQCYLAENVPVCCSLCANAFINVTGNTFT